MNILEKQQALDTIERLRKQKEQLKLERNNIDNAIIQLDMLIRDIRQKIPSMDIVEPIPKTVKQKLTPEQELEQLIEQNEELTRQIEEKKKELIQND